MESSHPVTLADADCNVLFLELEWHGSTSISCHALASMLRSHRKLMHLSKNVTGISGILTLGLACLYHRQAEDVILKKANDKVDTSVRLKGPQVEDGCLKITQDGNS